MSQMRRQSDQVFWGVILIGVAILLLTGYWWPGVMFVMGAAMIVREVNEGREWSSNRNALVMIGLGIVFALWDVLHFAGEFLWPLVLIAIGAYLLFGNQIRGRMGGGKGKNDML